MSLLTEEIRAALTDKINLVKAAFLPKYFKAIPGGYGEGDFFMGISVPDQRAVAKDFFKEISLPELSELLKDRFHELRMTALLMLVYKYEKLKEDSARKELVEFYLAHLDGINNWDLVDSSCHQILGHYFFKRDKNLFYEFADSGNLWKQRIAMISSFFWINKGEFSDALALAEKLLNHPHDLMHKAVGWTLRVIGDQDFNVEYEFLRKHYQSMPRTALRYSIEKFPEEMRQDFLKGRI
ncbi:MAG: DNA alkylation repair protein [Algoriphagus sp.]|nr:DNA alkylation repair protein [Algoriphagus sp.]